MKSYVSPNHDTGLSPFQHEDLLSRLESSSSNQQLNHKNIAMNNNHIKRNQTHDLQQEQIGLAKQQRKNHSLFTTTTNQAYNNSNLPPIMKINFDSLSTKQIEHYNITIKNQENQGQKEVKRTFLLKRQMSETRFQEYKRQQHERLNGKQNLESADDFLSSEKVQKNRQKLVRVDDEGKVQKRSILGTPDVYNLGQRKISEQLKPKKIPTNSTLGNSQPNILKSSIQTPQSRMIRNNRTSIHDISSTNSNQPQQGKVVLFQGKNQVQQQKIVSNQYLDQMSKLIQDRIFENQQQDDKIMSQIPLGIKLKQTQSQRILQQYDHIKDFWQKKKEHFAQKSNKAFVDLSVMQQTDEYRKKLETQELIDKTFLNIETLGQTLWKANLRNHHSGDNNPKALSSKFLSKTNQSQEALKKLALKEQTILEQKESSTTFLMLESLNSCADISSVYLDRTYKPTEIIRTPNFDKAKQYQELTGSIIFDKTNENAKADSPTKGGLVDSQLEMMASQSKWIKNFNQDIIIEEEDPAMYKTTESIKSIFINQMGETQRSRFQNSNKVSLRIQDLDTETQSRMGIANFHRTSQFSGMKSMSSTMSRQKRHSLEMQEQTINQFKQTHSHLISPTRDDDAELLCIQGTSKLQLELQGAKKINDPKILLPHEAINGEFEDSKDRDEIIAIDYDQRLFY
ncbi:UNKNOWN [Stylonychia lemnae]|uniref:Uncharacterized protein n=1 Tax=Stylonychia lemnae TaxID=5949 RepID=A0A077ZM70_STYLE|nr:UNKNOWN [Stylonychia lemnae]|eukprot:CDW71092.1 UNKNOWN [Stylonychia lemnae]